jgi:hypothetical protein
VDTRPVCYPEQRAAIAAADPEFAMPIVNRLADMQAEVAEWRQDMHAHPEILFGCTAPPQASPRS